MVRLVDGKDTSSDVLAGLPYVTLSYRWSSTEDQVQQRLMLTKATEQRLRHGFRFHDLPATLRDACIVVQNIGYPYLWIDRLCIVQDSFEDWAAEAGSMAQIYNNAHLNIHASCASDEDAGFLRSRTLIRAGIQPLRVRSVARSRGLQQMRPVYGNTSPDNAGRLLEHHTGTGNDVVFTPRLVFGDADETRGKLGHLAARGWIFQERKFSRRKIFFSGEIVHWECNEVRADEIEYGGSKIRRIEARSGSPRHDWWRPSPWQELIQDYSGTKLTFRRDKLWAIAGLARETRAGTRAGIHDERYYAGLWRSTFIADLTWTYQDHRHFRSEYCGAYVAPSWSWASAHGRVRWHLKLHPDYVVEHASVKDVQLEYAEPGDVYGAVNDGRLVLEGTPRPLKLSRGRSRFDPSDAEWTLPDEEEASRHFDQHIDVVVDHPCLTALIGVAPDTQESLPLFCLPLFSECRASADRSIGGEFCCLLLAPNGTVRCQDPSNGSSTRIQKSATGAEGQWPEVFQLVGFAVLNTSQDLDRVYSGWASKYPVREVVIR
ncbi:heterokaryon incompatibility protein-domain-containing protein [Microdochium trichocladiopsis]|uniref:Heterokaryon incompatibility protein-domain-containing protein n=1 Tax=Microdochium trichocladiopsis TaxID=1682393 RepID=A0A9P9BN05_9PEZI|nr:heterokaryon incompatibility protein-domain-containing protein [Microdochium trichocladiopsis]KAH7027221.1 heterokaryon incompatibility protein-domain-containing protein [Microdochium trichocladiopsis]